MVKILKYKLKNSGISLVEILIAISIAAFAFMPIIKIFTSSTRNSQTISNYATARELASKTMDELLSLDFDKLTSSTIPTIFNKNVKKIFKITVKIDDKNPTFHVRQKNLSGFISSPIACPGSVNDLKIITVSVSWKGVSSVQKYELQALKADLYR